VYANNRNHKGGILLEPILTDLDTWFKDLDRFVDAAFKEDGNRQPPMPKAADLFDRPSA
jgi:hypothetical protein